MQVATSVDFVHSYASSLANAALYAELHGYVSLLRIFNPGELADFPLVGDRDPPMSAGNLFAKVVAMSQLLSLPISSASPSDDSSLSNDPTEEPADPLYAADISDGDANYMYLPRDDEHIEESSEDSNVEEIIPFEIDDSTNSMHSTGNEDLDPLDANESPDEPASSKIASEDTFQGNVGKRQQAGMSRQPAGPSRLKRILTSLPGAIYPGVRASSEEVSEQVTEPSNADLSRAATHRDPIDPSASQSDSANSADLASSRSMTASSKQGGQSSRHAHRNARNDDTTPRNTRPVSRKNAGLQSAAKRGNSSAAGVRTSDKEAGSSVAGATSAANVSEAANAKRSVAADAGLAEAVANRSPAGAATSAASSTRPSPKAPNMTSLSENESRVARGIDNIVKQSAVNAAKARNASAVGDAAHRSTRTKPSTSAHDKLHWMTPERTAKVFGVPFTGPRPKPSTSAHDKLHWMIPERAAKVFGVPFVGPRLQPPPATPAGPSEKKGAKSPGLLHGSSSERRRSRRAAHRVSGPPRQGLTSDQSEDMDSLVAQKSAQYNARHGRQSIPSNQSPHVAIHHPTGSAGSATKPAPPAHPLRSFSQSVRTDETGSSQRGLLDAWPSMPMPPSPNNQASAASNDCRPPGSHTSAVPHNVHPGDSQAQRRRLRSDLDNSTSMRSRQVPSASDAQPRGGPSLQPLEAVLYLDLDAWFQIDEYAHTPLEDFLPPHAHLSLQSSSDVCSCVFMARSSEWTQRFLARWAELGKRGCCPEHPYDQLALHATLLEYGLPDVGLRDHAAQCLPVPAAASSHSLATSSPENGSTPLHANSSVNASSTLNGGSHFNRSSLSNAGYSAAATHSGFESKSQAQQEPPRETPLVGGGNTFDASTAEGGFSSSSGSLQELTVPFSERAQAMHATADLPSGKNVSHATGILHPSDQARVMTAMGKFPMPTNSSQIGHPATSNASHRSSQASPILMPEAAFLIQDSPDSTSAEARNVSRLPQPHAFDSVPAAALPDQDLDTKTYAAKPVSQHMSSLAVTITSLKGMQNLFRLSKAGVLSDTSRLHPVSDPLPEHALGPNLTASARQQADNLSRTSNLHLLADPSPMLASSQPSPSAPMQQAGPNPKPQRMSTKLTGWLQSSLTPTSTDLADDSRSRSLSESSNTDPRNSSPDGIFNHHTAGENFTTESPLNTGPRAASGLPHNGDASRAENTASRASPWQVAQSHAPLLQTGRGSIFRPHADANVSVTVGLGGALVLKPLEDRYTINTLGYPRLQSVGAAISHSTPAHTSLVDTTSVRFSRSMLEHSDQPPKDNGDISSPAPQTPQEPAGLVTQGWASEHSKDTAAPQDAALREVDTDLSGPVAGRIEGEDTSRRALLGLPASHSSSGSVQARSPTSHWVQQLWKPEQQDYQARWNPQGLAPGANRHHRTILADRIEQRQPPDVDGSPISSSNHSEATNGSGSAHLAQQNSSVPMTSSSESRGSHEDSNGEADTTASAILPGGNALQRQEVDSWCFANVLRRATGNADVPEMLQQGRYLPPEIHFVAEGLAAAEASRDQQAAGPQLWNCPAGAWEGCTVAPALIFHTSHWKWDRYADQIPLEIQ